MSPKSKAISKIPDFNDEKEAILNRWLDEIKSNAHFNNETLSKHDGLKRHASGFLGHLINTPEGQIPEFTTDTIDPTLKLWHTLLQNQMKKGFTSKDMVMLIFSLKNSITKYLESDPDCPHIKNYQNLLRILDFLGILTFELYTAEKERLISWQSEQIHYLQGENQTMDFGDLIGESPQMKAIFKAIGLVLENDATVLLEGESGTGKDRIASILHQNSHRSKEPFVAINCGAIPKELIESELFGYEKGAFTGAENRKLGKFELAHNGTLFLDEVGELPLEAQVKLLRALQNREIERVGGTEAIQINVRIIAATNQDLKQAVTDKRFRSDLFYRLNVYPIQIPPLRERQEDIIPLAQFFLKKYAASFNSDEKSLSEDACHYLLNQKWEGNIRELENLMQRAIIMTKGDIVTSAILDSEPGQTDISDMTPRALPEATENTAYCLNKDIPIIPLDELEKKAILHALDVEDGNVSQVAEALDVSRTTLYSKMKKFGIDPDAYDT